MKNSQLKIMFLMLLLTAATPLFAALEVPAGLNTLGTDLVNIFSGSLVRSILIICLAGCGVAYGFNKDNEKMKRSIIAIAVAIGIIATASAIVGAVFTATGNTPAG